MLVLGSFCSMVNAAIVIEDKRWPQHTTLNIWFLDGTAKQQQLVAEASAPWQEHTNLNFRFFSKRPAESHIRISFIGYDGSSFGKHNALNDTQPTMRLGSLASSLLSRAIKTRIVLHEFGHALGFEHEFLHPEWPYGDAWRVFQQQECEQRLSDFQLDQVADECRRANKPLTHKNSWWYGFDEYSIMMYPIDSQWLDGRSQDIATPLVLSPADKAAAALAYPPDDFGEQRNPPPPGQARVVFGNLCAQTVTLQISEESNQETIRLYAFERSKPLIFAQPVTLSALQTRPSAQYAIAPSLWSFQHSDSPELFFPIYCRS